MLKDISFELYQNDCLAIVGSSGSGKTTLIQHFTGLLKPEKGRVLFEGNDIWDKKYKKSELRHRIGLVFQFPESQLFEETVYRDVAFGPQNLGFGDEQLDTAVTQALADVDLDKDQFADRSPFRLSEGEKRRVAIAGVLAMQPDIIVMDEPTAGLDPQGVRKIISIVQRQLQIGKTVVVVTHNMDFVQSICNRVLAMESGSLLFDGKPDSLFASPGLLARTGLDLPLLLQAQMEYGDKLPPDLKSLKNVTQLLALIK